MALFSTTEQISGKGVESYIAQTTQCDYSTLHITLIKKIINMHTIYKLNTDTQFEVNYVAFVEKKQTVKNAQ